MSTNPRIKARICDDLDEAINKKLQLKKYAAYDRSKFLRAAIDNFVDQNLFNYISNINTIIEISNEIVIDLNGLFANITQIHDHLKDIPDEEIIRTVDKLEYCKEINKTYVQNIKKLIKLLKPFEQNKQKNEEIMTRIDPNTKNNIKLHLKTYDHLKMDTSKIIRAALKFYINKKYYDLSWEQIKYSRELMHINIRTAEITNDINRVAYELNSSKDLDQNDLIESVDQLNILLHDVDQVVTNLYKPSLKINQG